MKWTPPGLRKYIPAGTELDSFDGRTYASVVGFQFRRTKLLGTIPIPFHTDFEEINLRFYVRRSKGGEARRGVVFITEIVPKRAIAFAARLFYNENYVRRPMAHRIFSRDYKVEVEYSWRTANQSCKLQAHASGTPSLPAEGSLEQFITEHHWDTRVSPTAAPWNITSRTSPGKSGMPPTPNFPATLATSTAKNFPGC